MSRTTLTALATMTLLPACSSALAEPTHLPDRSLYEAPRAAAAPTVDGRADEASWQRASWRPIDQRWLGEALTAEDFSGRFKVIWTPQQLFMLAEITDDVLHDSHRDPLVEYWNDDTLEFFVDADFSGGDHQFNHNAFAYHVALDNQAIDLDRSQSPRNYTQHVTSRWQQKGNVAVWELAISVYDDQYIDGAEDNTPVTLKSGASLGFMVAYCDADFGSEREHFIGSEAMPGEDKNRGWIDASVFGQLVLGD
ncbi:MAG: CBM9 family sugar-binding protein [Gammaproteobacteria bacterium]